MKILHYSSGYINLLTSPFVEIEINSNHSCRLVTICKELFLFSFADAIDAINFKSKFMASLRKFLEDEDKSSVWISDLIQSGLKFIESEEK